MCMFSIQGDAHQCTSDGDMSQGSNRSTCVDLRATVCYAVSGFVGGVLLTAALGAVILLLVVRSMR